MGEIKPDIHIYMTADKWIRELQQRISELKEIREWAANGGKKPECAEKYGFGDNSARRPMGIISANTVAARGLNAVATIVRCE